jgi:hypothetical protein
MRALLCLCLLGCGFRVQGGVGDDSITPPDGGGTDTSGDGAANSDANSDASVDASIDAGFTPVQLLVNPAFDATTLGWIENAALITDEDGVVEDTAPKKVWMGGVPSTTHVLYQDVVVPPGATTLVFTGKVEVRSSDSTTIAYDSARVQLTTTTGQVLVTLVTLDNTMTTTLWLPLYRSVAAPSGTIRFRISATNDQAAETSFFFDTFSLIAQ